LLNKFRLDQLAARQHRVFLGPMAIEQVAQGGGVQWAMLGLVVRGRLGRRLTMRP